MAALRGVQRWKCVRYRKMDTDASNGVLPQTEISSDSLLTSSTNIRTQTLRILQQELQDQSESSLLVLKSFVANYCQAADPNLIQNILPKLFLTYPRYQDRESRKAVQACLRASLQNPTLALNAISALSKFLLNESQRPVSAPSNAFVLLEWCVLLQQEISKNAGLFEQAFLDVSSAASFSFEKCLDSGSKSGLRGSAVVTARRGLRSVLGSPELGEDALKGLLSRLASDPTAVKENVPYVGVVAGVCSRIPKRGTQMASYSKSVLAFYVKTILGSRTLVPLHIASGLHDFFSTFVHINDFSSDIVPALEKAILRSPEIVLQTIIPSLVGCLPTGTDLSEILSISLLQPLLSSFKSTNSGIRDGAYVALEALLKECRESIWLCKITEELITQLKSVKPTEQRNLLARSLMIVPVTSDVSQIVVRGATPVAAKETNEPALEAEVGAICVHLTYLLDSDDRIEKSLLDSILKGYGDRRPAFRKIWILKIANTLWNLKRVPEELESAEFVVSALEKSLDVFGEIAPNPIPAVQSSVVSTGYAIVALGGSSLLSASSFPSIKSDALLQQSLIISPKPSFLLNNKVYARLNTSEDRLWAIRALTSAASALANAMDDVKVAWAQAILYLLTSSDVDSTTRKETGKALSTVYYDNPKSIGTSIILGIWHWVRALAAGQKDSTAVVAKSERANLYLALRHISPPKSAWLEHELDFPEETVKSQLVSAIVLCRPELVPRVNWITTCLLIGVDPGALARERSEQLINEVLHQFEKGNSRHIIAFETAACNAAADLAFVAPELIISLIVKQLQRDLEPVQLSNLGPTEAAISRAPEDVPFIDILSQKANGVLEDKNTKDYDVLKWEAEVRSQVAEKRGQQKKLSQEQQAKVAAQLVQEASTREVVRKAVSNIRRGAGLVQSLALGPPTDARTWMIEGTQAILRALQAGAELFVDDELTLAYLACSNQVSPRLGILRQSIGIATLRAAGYSHFPSGYSDEPLGELTTRVLYRLRFAAEQRPFDTVSLGYMLPLIFIVVDNGAVGHPSGEDADAQVLLALEFLSFQMSSCSDVYLPRAHILGRLITSLQRYTQHYRLLKDALLEFCRCISANIRQTELHVLLQGVTVPEESVRSAVLQAIHAEIDLTDLDHSREVWIACHDEDEENAELAVAIWEENRLGVEEALVFQMLDYLRSTHRPTRIAAARALGEAIEANPSTFAEAMDFLQKTYSQEAKPLLTKRDKFGIIVKADLTDHWEVRSGIAIAFKALTKVFQTAAIVPFTRFLIDQGPFADRNGQVRNEMVEAGTNIVSTRGGESLEPLMRLFEEILDAPDQATQELDWINEAVVVLYGSLARHLQVGDARVQTVISKLLGTLRTPSEPVQYAVAGCLPPLVRLADAEIKNYVELLLNELFNAKRYASRRGAAFGLAGIVHGGGISMLRQFRIMSALRSATDDKKSMTHRQGALFAYELLSFILGSTFEPYVIEVLPQLLSCFGDPDASVRESCLDTAKTCFASLSSFGVRQVLPRLLEGLDEPQWRSKKGACDLLGAMAYLDPQQLANSLPDIIPPLTAVLNDSHKEVRGSANRSLQRFGEVISNPEVKSLVNLLLKALSDPTKYTEDALDGLIKVSFVHYLDSPSLALVVRILERGLSGRSSTKRKAAQIIGSLAHLTERRDLILHLPILVSGLRLAVIDPVPATRATSSKALGSLVEKLGEDALPDLIPSLMASLRSDTGAGDRLGSAQALSEVLAGLGTTRLEDTLPTILQNVSSTKPSVREGFMTLFIFLPACFGNNFAAYLSQIIPSILGGLADDLEAIRDTSLRAGRLLVKNFATKAIDLLLPELQRGLADDSYRIRLSSVELVGDLLFNLTGISSKGEAEEEGESATQAGQSLLEVLGEERRNKVLSSLYICRCDTSGLVRSGAIAVWKALVATPRTLRELVPTLTQMIIVRLASSNMEHKVIAGNALGEVIRKAGEGVLAALLPSLEDGLLTSTDPDNRQGICIALREVVNAASPEAIEDYEKKLISIVRIALVDSDEDVREAAAESFDSLQQVFGKRAVDQVLPHLLNLLRNEHEAENALSALLTLLTETTRANVILPILIPTLLTTPMTVFNAKALASLARVGGSSMTRRLPIVLNTLAENIISTSRPEMRIELDSAFDALLSSVDEFDGLNTAMSVMLALIKHDDHRKRAVAASHLATFFSAPTVDYSRYNQDLIRVLLISFDDRDKEVVRAAWDALSQLTGHLRKEEMESLVISTRQILQQVGVVGSNMPGFSLPKGILPVLQIFLQGLMNGTTEQRMQSALGISDIIDRAGPDSLKPFVTQITGPLIRVVSERSIDVKCAILQTLSQLLEKIPMSLRPFLPQLQRTFTKSLADPSSDILRTRATKALSTLITLTPRVDPLIAELVTGAKTQDKGVRNAMLKGLQEVVSKVGSNMSDTSKEAILDLVDLYREAGDENMTVTNARLLGAMIKVLPPSSASALIKNRVLTQPSTDASVLALNAVLLESPSSLINAYLGETRNVLCHGLSSKSTFVQQNSVLASGKFLLGYRLPQDSDSYQVVLSALATSIRPGADIDTRRLALVVLRTVSRKHPDAVRPSLAELAAPVFASVRDPVIPVKLAAEAAFLELFDVVEAESAVFDWYMSSDSGPGKELPTATQRSMTDYFKRVALRLGSQARERRDAEGGQGGLGLASDETEDEREVWSVGKVELNNGDAGFVHD